MERDIELLKNKYGLEKTDKLISYLDMVLDRNQFINLTAVKNRGEAFQKHIVDSLSICDLPEYVKAKKIIDVGTGAGFPGALLAIVSPEKEFVLLDSTKKRLNVIDEFADVLELKNITTIHARAEEISKKEGYAESFDLCVSRAVANLTTLAAWCLPFVRPQGHLVSYKGENFQEEIEAAKKELRRQGGRIERIISDSNSDTLISGHVLLVIRKEQ